jgi:hypothetical protein
MASLDEQKRVVPPMRIVGAFDSLVSASTAAISLVSSTPVSCKIAKLEVVKGSPLVLSGEALANEGASLLKQAKKRTTLVQEVQHPSEKEPPAHPAINAAFLLYAYTPLAPAARLAWPTVTRWIKEDVAPAVAALDDDVSSMPPSKENDHEAASALLFLVWQSAKNANLPAKDTLEALLACVPFLL